MADEPVEPQMDAADDEVADLLPAYALGALDAADALVVERVLDREPRYRELLQEYLESAAALAGSHAFAVPGSEVRERIMGRVRGSATVPVARPAPRVPFALLGVAAALAVAVMGLGAFSTMQQQRVAELQDEVDVVTAEAEGTRSELVGLTDRVAESVAMTPLTPAQPIAESVPPAGSGQDGSSGGNGSSAQGEDKPPYGGHARGILIRGPDGESMLVAMGLRSLEPGYIYRAWWWDAEHRTKSAAVFTVSEDGYAWVRLIGHAGSMSRLGVSVEPEMGAVEPGPELVLHGHVHLVDGDGEPAQ